MPPEDAEFHCNTDLWSCSLTCFKQHRVACSATPQRINSAAPSIPSRNEDPQQSAQIPSLRAEDLQTLFKQHPTLRAQLQRIYQSTQEPSEVSRASAPEQDGRPLPARPWKHENGFHSGLKSLQATLDHGGPDAEGVAAFVRLLAGRANLAT